MQIGDKPLEERLLSDADLNWLHVLVSDWQVVADLAAADLVMWLPTDDGRFIVFNHCRPATSSTVHVDHIIGLYLPVAREEHLRRAMETGSIIRPEGLRWVGTYSVKDSCIPVFHDGRVIAVMTCESNLSAPQSSAGISSWTEETADILLNMIAIGEYPYSTMPSPMASGVPRVMDGAILLDECGVVREISPNGSSNLQRLGIRHSVIGRVLAEDITEVIANENIVEETLAVVVMGRAPWQVEVSSGPSTVNMRALPLTRNGKRLGALLLTRDVSESRRREQELMTKDATIREIHHRVKNNLQTVSALLRLQARRSDSLEVGKALQEAERRVQSIATVHESLSQNVDEEVDFDTVAHSIIRLCGTVASTSHHVEVTTQGCFGVIPASQAQALATVLNELVANAVEHGLKCRDGVVRVCAERTGPYLIVKVIDDGQGIDPDVPMSGLGTQIVRQMTRGELHGTIDWSRGEQGGTVVTIRVLLDQIAAGKNGAQKVVSEV